MMRSKHRTAVSAVLLSLMTALAVWTIRLLTRVDPPAAEVCALANDYRIEVVATGPQTQRWALIDCGQGFGDSTPEPRTVCRLAVVNGQAVRLTPTVIHGRILAKRVGAMTCLCEERVDRVLHLRLAADGSLGVQGRKCDTVEFRRIVQRLGELGGTELGVVMELELPLPLRHCERWICYVTGELGGPFGVIHPSHPREPLSSDAIPLGDGSWPAEPAPVPPPEDEPAVPVPVGLPPN